MPLYELFEGIKIYLYFNDHLPPHIHAMYGEYEVLIDIRTFEVYRGELPNKQLKKVTKFVKENQDDLLETFYELNPEIKKL